MPLLFGLERLSLLEADRDAVYAGVADPVLPGDLPDGVTRLAVAEEQSAQIEGHGWHGRTPECM